ncbi:50S ribosomal protein L19 [Candidatus Johnevansia muelleri]|uniref:50S ribosomal protein L19 n=1 Tax=Candidatus Johnevansia muelleri TaxID=1495769 RepID=A0A078KAT8_9GAMM|nr:50S ribosomal protein L19 [Candidatus Evansia muelleri]
MNKILKKIEDKYITNKKLDFKPGDTIIVKLKIIEGNRYRLQLFEGIVIAKRKTGLNLTFIVRKISYGIGVEWTFQAYSPLIKNIEIKRRGLNIHKSKLYYLR